MLIQFRDTGHIRFFSRLYEWLKHSCKVALYLAEEEKKETVKSELSDDLGTSRMRYSCCNVTRRRCRRSSPSRYLSVLELKQAYDFMLHFQGNTNSALPDCGEPTSFNCARSNILIQPKQAQWKNHDTLTQHRGE
jgi:hypothetical protein